MPGVDKSTDKPVRIGTRGSKLALWQASWVEKAISSNFPSVPVEIVIIKTKGDKILDVPLAKVGGKGLFVKEIEEALLDGRIDIAVHSMKDMPAIVPDGLCIGAVPERENPSDVLISLNGDRLADLPKEAKIGTSSLRRSAQILHLRPDFQIVPLRGNLDTRLKKLRQENLDAIIVAAAGVIRLELNDHVTQYLEPDTILPAVGQGALCIEIRKNDNRIESIVSPIDHESTRTAVTGERAFLKHLEGGCQIPVAAFGTIEGDSISLTGMVADIDGSTVFRKSMSGRTKDCATIGVELAEALIDMGAKPILDRLRQQE